MSTMSGSMLSMGSEFGPGDPKMDQALAKRRQLEAERLKRVKDPKLRVMGVDCDALAAQVAEKAAMTEADKNLKLAYDEQRLLQDQQLAYLEQERLRAERVKAQQMDEFRSTLQGVEKAREFDLNDPQGKLKDTPARVGDDDPRMSVSGMQMFHGEDLSYADRVKMQQQEIKQWADEGVRLKAEADAAAKADLEAYAKYACDLDAYKNELESTARQSRTATNVAVAEFQLAQAAAKRERELAAQQSELQDNVEEIQKTLASDTMTENPSVGRSFAAPNRLRPDHYKGMSPAEQAAILADQATQRAQMQAALNAAKAEQAATDAEMEAMRKAGAYQDAKVASIRADMRKKLSETNKVLAEQQYSNKSYLDSTVFKNDIDETFYEQFNTTSR